MTDHTGDVLTWNDTGATHYTYHRAKHNEHLFEVGQHHKSGTFYLHILERGRGGKWLKSSVPRTLEAAKKEAELFILNLKK